MVVGNTLPNYKIFTFCISNAGSKREHDLDFIVKKLAYSIKSSKALYDIKQTDGRKIFTESMLHVMIFNELCIILITHYLGCHANQCILIQRYKILLDRQFSVTMRAYAFKNCMLFASYILNVYTVFQ